MRLFVLALLTLYSLTVGAQDMNTAKSDCETLLNAAMPLAKQLLQKYGEFLPYGAAIKRDGKIASIAGYDGREQPPSNDVIKILKQAFIQGAKSQEYKATALVYDVRVTSPSTKQKTDAIAIALNHRDSYSVVVFFPYQLASGHLEFGETFAQKGDADIFKNE